MNLGLRPSNFEFIYEAPALLKRDLLFFDQIHVCSYNDVKVFNDLQALDPELNEARLKEFDFLRSNGLLCDFNLSEMIEFTFKKSGIMKKKGNPIDQFDLMQIYESYYAIPSVPLPKNFTKKQHQKDAHKIIEKYITSVNKAENEATRVSSAFLNRFAAKDNATAILQDNFTTDLPNFKTAPVLEVVLKKLPIPNANVDWQQIIEYRADPDSSVKFTALRVWMQDIASKEYKPAEIEERIDHLLNEYERHISLHKLKFKRTTRHIFLNSPLEILEDLLKLKWSTLGKKLFSFEEKQFDLMQAELNAPGRELAYISKANEKFA